MGEEDRFTYCIGRVLRAHGVNGDVTLQLFRPRRNSPQKKKEPAEVLLSFKNGDSEARRLEHARFTEATKVVAHFAGIDDRDDAERIVGTLLDIDPNDPPEGLLDEADRLFEAEVQHEGASLGQVRSLSDNGAQTLLVVGDKEILIPFIEEMIERIDVAEDGSVVVHISPPEGLLELYDPQAGKPKPAD